MEENVVVISKSGHEMTLTEWQKYYGLTVGSKHIGVYFTLDEDEFQDNIRDYGKVVVNEILMKVLDRFRAKVGVPVIINAFNRDEAKQEQLRKDGFRAAMVSPHVALMAADIDTTSNEQTEKWVVILQQVAIDLGVKIRIGYKQYQLEHQTFIHIDVCPEFFGKDKPYHDRPHPSVWEKQITW